LKRSLFRCTLWAALGAAAGCGQTLVDLKTQAKSIDFSAATSTRPVKVGTTLPASCTMGDLFFDSDAPAGANLYGCVSANTWALETGGGAGAENPSQSFTAQTVVTLAHNLGTQNILVRCYDGANRAIEFDSLVVTGGNSAVVTFATPQTGRCVANGTGGGGTGGGGGGGSGEANTASNVGVGGVGLFLAKSGVDLEFKTINAGSGRIVISNDAVNKEVDVDVNPASLDLGALGGSLTASQIATASKQGGGAKVQMFGGGVVAANDCAKFDAAGNVVSNGGPCSAGGSGDTISADQGIVVTPIAPLSKSVGVDTATVPTYLSATASLDFPSIAQSACAEETISLVGAGTGDSVAAGWPSLLEAGLVGMMWVSSTNTVRIRLCKITTGSVDPAESVFRATIVRTF